MKKLITVLTVVLTLLCSTIFSFAAEDPNVVLVNPTPNSTVYSNNLLISVKLSQPKTIRVGIYAEMQMVNGTLAAVNANTLTSSGGALNSANFTPVPIAQPETFESKNKLSFYTKQVNNLKPGLYMIKIDTLEGSKEIYSRSSYVVVKEKVEGSEKIFDAPQSGTMQFLQNLLKTIFGE